MRKPVLITNTLTGEQVHCHTIAEAARRMGIRPGSLHYRFEVMEKFQLGSWTVEFDRTKDRKQYYSKKYGKVKRTDTHTGEEAIFPSIRAAAEGTYCSVYAVRQSLLKNTACRNLGYKFTFAEV